MKFFLCSKVVLAVTFSWLNASFLFSADEVSTPVVVKKDHKKFQKLFYLFLDGKYEDYLEFVSMQPKDRKLLWSDFLAIQAELNDWIVQHGIIQASSWKQLIPVAVFLLEEIGNKNLNSFGLEQSFESFNSECELIAPEYKELSKDLKLFVYHASSIQYLDSILRLDGGPEILSHLKKSLIQIKDPIFLDFVFTTYLLKLAAEPLQCGRGLDYDHHIYQACIKVKNFCRELLSKSEEEVYYNYLSVRAEWLGLDPASPLHCVLTRIGGMLLLYSPEEGKILKESLLKLVPEDLALVMEEFSITKKEKNFILPLSIPTVLFNLVTNSSLGEGAKERLEKTVQIGVPFLAKVLKQQRELVLKNQLETKVPLKLDSIAKIAQEDPKKLINFQFQVNSNGTIDQKL
jgi:hypothetical protein